MLSPTHLHTLFSLTEEIEFLFTKLSLYGNELMHMAGGQSPAQTAPPWYVNISTNMLSYSNTIKASPHC